MTSAPALPIFDRAGHLRGDTERLTAALDAPSTVLVPVWQGQVLATRRAPEQAPGMRAVLPTVGSAAALIDRADELVWLGLLGEAHCFAVDLSSAGALEAVPGLGTAPEPVDLRAVGSLLAGDEAGLLAYARGMLHWHATHRYCGSCGAPTRPRKGGHERECTRDGQKHFPRTDPAIMALVCDGERCVLARQRGWPQGMYSVLAGFVEPGETLEQAVRREVREEVGLEVESPRYLGSQPWPFPASLMVGFTATALGDELRVDGEELEHARWVSREELATPRDFFYPPPFSLAHTLIQRFLTNAL